MARGGGGGGGWGAWGGGRDVIKKLSFTWCCWVCGRGRHGGRVEGDVGEVGGGQ